MTQACSAVYVTYVTGVGAGGNASMQRCVRNVTYVTGVNGVQAATELDAYFGGKRCGKRPCCVVLVDELDHLVTRKQVKNS